MLRLKKVNAKMYHVVFVYPSHPDVGKGVAVAGYEDSFATGGLGGIWVEQELIT